MSLAVPFNDFARQRQALRRLSTSDGSAFADMKPSAPSIGSSFLPNDWERHFSSTKKDDSYFSMMWGGQGSCDTTVKTESSPWHEWQDENSYFSLPRSSDAFPPPYDSYGKSALDAASEFLDSVSLSSPSDYRFPQRQTEGHLPSAFSTATDIFSMNEMPMVWQDFSSQFQETPESLTELHNQQPSSYLPPSPTLSESSYGSIPSMSQSSNSSHYSLPSYPSTPTSSTSSYSPHLQEEPSRPSPSTSKSSTGATEGNALRPHPCLYPDCGRWFTRSYTRNVHMLTHRRSNDPKPFGCTIPGCSEGFSRKHDRLRHEVRQHGRGSNWRCPLCPTSRFYSSQTTLERHLSEKHHKDG